jgi:hypothetical protein
MSVSDLQLLLDHCHFRFRFLNGLPDHVVRYEYDKSNSMLSVLQFGSQPQHIKMRNIVTLDVPVKKTYFKNYQNYQIQPGITLELKIPYDIVLKLFNNKYQYDNTKIQDVTNLFNQNQQYIIKNQFTLNLPKYQQWHNYNIKDNGVLLQLDNLYTVIHSKKFSEIFANKIRVPYSQVVYAANNDILTASHIKDFVFTTHQITTNIDISHEHISQAQSINLLKDVTGGILRTFPK